MSPAPRSFQLPQTAVGLAPMEGVTDFPMRQLQTEISGFDWCVTEFLRVTHQVPPDKVFRRFLPELNTESHTLSGVPVQLQLLGGDAQVLAASALRAIELGAAGIDLNFGCPAPTVNRHDGGATLLKYPDRIFDIVKTVRAAVPQPYPVSAKLRLGWDDKKAIFLNAEKAALAGASWITIHGRTRLEGYRPPADWAPIALVVKALSIPVVANGDINTIEDFKRCREISQASHFMVGRGALARPGIAREFQRLLGKPCPPPPFSFQDERGIDWRCLLARFYEHCEPFFREPGYVPRRIKQWIKFASVQGQIDWFDQIKRCQTYEEMMTCVPAI